MSGFESDLIMNAVRVDRFEYRLNDSYDPDLDDSDATKISVVPIPKIQRGDSSKGRLDLEVTISDENFIDNNENLFLKIVVVALFEDPTITKDSEVDVFDKYLANAISMLYPYVRSYISSITGMFGIDVVQIPPINVLKLLEHYKTRND